LLEKWLVVFAKVTSQALNFLCELSFLQGKESGYKLYKLVDWELKSVFFSRGACPQAPLYKPFLQALN